MVQIKTNEIRRFEPTDRAHADLFNTMLEALIANDVELAKSRKTTEVLVKMNGFTGQAPPYSQRIDVQGIKQTDTPIVSFSIPDGVTNLEEAKKIEKAYKCIHKVETHDGYIIVRCFGKKPERNVVLLVKEA
jgi:hypothetical protein|nr:MAG TPA: hypothetical protein [Caudoviricetes sp.]